MSNASDCPTVCTFLTSLFVLSVPLSPVKNGSDAQNIKGQKHLGLGSASPKDTHLRANNDVEDMLDDLRAQEILGPKEDLLAALERIPKPVTIEAATQKECKAPSKATVPEPSEAGPVKSAVQASNEAVAFGKAASQIPNKASTPIRAAVLAPNMGVAPSPPLSESLFTVKAVLPTLNKNAASAVSTAPASSEAAAEGKTATPSMSSITQMISGPAPSNTTTTAVAAPLASYKGMTSYRTIVPTQSEAAARGRVAVWAPSKDIFSSAAALPASSKVTFFDLPAPSVPTKGSVKTAVSATAEAAAKDKVTVAAPGKAATSIVAAPLAPSKVAFSGLASSWTQCEGQVQARDGATAPMLGFSDTAVLPVTDESPISTKAAVTSPKKDILSGMALAPAQSSFSVLDKTAELAQGKVTFSGLPAPERRSKDPVSVKILVSAPSKDAFSSIAAEPASSMDSTTGKAAVPAVSSMGLTQGKKVVMTTNEALGRAAVAGLTKFSVPSKAAPSTPSECFVPVKAAAPTSSKDALLDVAAKPSRIDSAPGEALTSATTEAGASVLSPSEGPAPVKNLAASTSRDTTLGVAAARAPVRVAFSGLSTPSAPNEETFPVKAEIPILVKDAFSGRVAAPTSSMVLTIYKAATSEFLRQGKSAFPSPSEGPALVKDTVPIPSEGSVPVKDQVSSPGRDAFPDVTAAQPPIKAAFSGLSPPPAPSEGAVVVKTAVPTLVKNASSGIEAPPISNIVLTLGKAGGDLAPVKDTEAAASEVSVPDSVPSPGRDPFLGVTTVQPIKPAFTGLAAPPVQSKESFTIKAAVPKLGIDVVSAAVPATVSAKTSSMDSDPGKAVTLVTSEATAQGKVSVPEPSKFAFSNQTASRSAPSERSIPSPGRDPVLGVTAAQGTGMVAFSGLAVSLAPTEGTAVPNFGKDAVTTPAPVLSMSSTVGKNAVSATNEAAAQGRDAEAPPAKFSVSGQAASPIPSKGSVPVEGTKPEPRRADAFFGAASVKISGKDVSLSRATTLATSRTSAQDKVSLPEPSKSAFASQVISTPPSEGKILVKDSVPPPGRDGFLAVSAAKAPIRVAYSGIDSGATLSCGAVQGKAIVSPTSHSVSQGSDVIRKASRVAFLDLAVSPEPGEDSVSVKGDIPQTIKDTLLVVAAPTAQSKGLISAEGTILASSYPAASSVAVPPVPSESQILVKGASPTSNQGSFLVTATVQAQTEAAALSKVTVPAPSKVEALDVAAPSEPTQDVAPVKATQPTTCVDLFPLAEIATSETATLDKAAAPASVGIKGSLTHESESLIKPAVLASVKDAPPTLLESADLGNVAVLEPNKGLATGKAAVPSASATPVQETLSAPSRVLIKAAPPAHKEPAAPGKDIVSASDEAAAEGVPFVQIPNICLGQVSYAAPAQNVPSDPMKPLVQVESEVPTPSKALAPCEISVPAKSVVPAPVIPTILTSDKSASETCEASAIVEAAVPEPSKDFATVKAVLPASFEVPPVSCEASATVKAAVPSVSSDTVVEAAKPATSEVFAPEGGAFPQQNEATAPVKATPSPDTVPSDATIQRPASKAL